MRFQNPGDALTSAAIIVQTPAALDAYGGFIFVLSPSGLWQLQYVQTQKYLPILSRGFVSIDVQQSVQLRITVQKDVLFCFINNQPVVTWSDTLNPEPGEVGLLVEGTQSMGRSSIILYSHFELGAVSH